jgi:hypothetical protein
VHLVCYDLPQLYSGYILHCYVAVLHTYVWFIIDFIVAFIGNQIILVRCYFV